MHIGDYLKSYEFINSVVTNFNEKTKIHDIKYFYALSVLA